MRDFFKDAGNKGPAVGSLAALMNCIPGFNTAQLKEFLLKLQVPAVEEPGLPISGGELSFHIPSYIALYCTMIYNSVILQSN